MFWVFHDPGQAVIRADVVRDLALERVELFENLRNPESIAGLCPLGSTAAPKTVATYRPGADGMRYRIEPPSLGRRPSTCFARNSTGSSTTRRSRAFRIAVLSG